MEGYDRKANKKEGEAPPDRQWNGVLFHEFDQFCKNEEIVRHCTVRYTPQQNGVVERMNMTLLERARCMLSNVGLSKCFWAEAVNTACYLVNRSPSTAIDFKTPEEVWSSTPANYSHYEYLVALLIFM